MDLLQNENMSAPMEHTAFCQISKESEIISVTDSYCEDFIVVTNRTKCINVHKVEDQKVVASWSVRHGVQLTSPVAWDTESKNFVVIVNNQDVRIWTKETTDFDKARKKHAKVKLHTALAVPGFEAVIICQNGAVDFLSNVRDFTDSGPLSADEKIVWCQAGVHESRLYVICVVKNKGNVKLLVNRHMGDSDTWRSTSSPVSPAQPGGHLSACDVARGHDGFKLYLLWSSGELTSVVLNQNTISTQTCEQTVDGVHGSPNMVVIDETHIAVAGVTQNGTDGIGVYDVKFGILVSWQPYPGPVIHSPPKMFYVHNKLYVPCGHTLYMLRVECRPSTVASLLGRSQAHDQSHDHTVNKPLPQHYTWSSTRKRDRSPQKGTDLTALFMEVLETKRSYAKFKVAFQNLANSLEQTEHSHWLTSDHMTRLLQRCVGETKFWPRDEIQRLLDMKSLPTSLMPALLDALVDHTEIAMVDSLLHTLQDIPEKCLCTALGFYLQCEDVKVESALGESMDVEDDDQPYPLSPNKSHLVVLRMPYSDVFLLECLRDVSFKHSLKLLEYLCHLLETGLPAATTPNNDTPGRPSHPTQIQVVDWLCLVLDSHMTQFVLSPDAHLTLIKLHDVVASQRELYNGLVGLEALLEQLKARSSLPQDKKIGQYCIEVLHVF